MTKPKDKLRRMNDLTLNEISTVDMPMQEGARVAIIKRDDPVVKQLALTSQAAGHAHSIVSIGHEAAELRAGRTSYVVDHAHDWIKDEAGNYHIADAMGHNHGIAILSKDSEGGAPAAADGQGTAGVNKNTEHEKMTPEQIAALQKAAADAAAKIVELEKRATRDALILKLSPDQRAHFDTLKIVADQDAFLASPDAVMKNLLDTDPVVYTRTSGMQLRKSAGPLAIELAKENDQNGEKIRKAEAVAKQADLEKRARVELPNFGGEDVAVKAAVLGAVEGIADEGVRGKVLAAIKANDAGLGAALKNLGTKDAPKTGGTASDKLDALAKKHATDNKVSITKAYDAVCNTPEGAELYNQHRLETMGKS